MGLARPQNLRLERRLDVGPICLTRPKLTRKWSDPTTPDPKVTWNSEPDPAQPILLVVEKYGNILSELIENGSFQPPLKMQNPFSCQTLNNQIRINK